MPATQPSSSHIIFVSTMTMARGLITASALILATTTSAAIAFTSPPPPNTPSNGLIRRGGGSRSSSPSSPWTLSAARDGLGTSGSRRAFLATTTTTASAAVFSSGSVLLLPSSARAEEDVAGTTSTSDAFESIAARAAQVSRDVSESELAKQAEEETSAQRRRDVSQRLKDDTRSIYDFTLPVNGKAREVAELLGQTFGCGDCGDGWTDGGEGETVLEGGKEGQRVKAILVVNMKQDDPIARKNIPELIELSQK